MSKKDDALMKFAKLEEASKYFLEESFHYIHKAFEFNLAGTLMKEGLIKIKLTDEDKNLASGSITSATTDLEMLRGGYESPLSVETIEKLQAVWSSALNEAEILGGAFGYDEEASSVDVLGFVSNFAFFLEALVNRHVKFLQIEGEINSIIYKNLERTSAINKLMFLFKDEINKNLIDIGSIVSLSRLRNRAVHFTHENTATISINISQLKALWVQSSKIATAFHKVEKFDEEPFSDVICENMDFFIKRWIRKQVH